MSSRKNAFVLIGIVVVLALATWLLFQPTPLQGVPGGEEAGSVASTTETAASSTPVEPPKQKTLPPEPLFVLPEGATAIDGYAFIENNQVYFRSLTGAAPLAIPNSDAGSFTRLSDFMTYPGSEVVATCGGAPIYSYYGDEKQVYFYQVWRAPKFRSSKVEVIVGAKIEDFKVTGLQTATGGGRLFEVGYQKATTTCSLFLSRTTL